MGKNGKYTKVGESVTSHSFFDDKGNPVLGAVIDPKSKEGQNFIDGLVKTDPPLVDYIGKCWKW